MCSDVECLCAILIPFHQRKDTVALEKVKIRGFMKIGTTSVLRETKTGNLWAGRGEAEARRGGLKSQTYMEKLIRELLFSVYWNTRAWTTEGR